LHTDGRQIMLSDVFIRTRTGTMSKHFKKQSPFRFELYEPSGIGVLLSPDISESVFHKLFIMHLPDEQYFMPVNIKLPFYQIWEVRPDVFEG